MNQCHATARERQAIESGCTAMTFRTQCDESLGRAVTGSDNDSLISNFFAELRRRRVIRVVVVYLVVGWVVIEVAATMLPGLHLPAWTVTFVIALVVLGFPIAVALGWLFDLGPRGIERTAPVSDVAAVKSVVVAPAIAKPPTEAAEPAATAQDDRRTIAVLPFVNMSGDADNEYFSDGISEELLNLLAKLPQLKVSSRTSSFNLKGKEGDIRSAARQLGVSTILEGSVRRAGDRVRITAQLIEAESDSHLWSETYDRQMQDVFSIQDDIARRIVSALQVTLSPKERRAIQSVATTDAEAYDYYLRGRNYMYSLTRRDFANAIRMFEQAVTLDPKYAAAHAGIADAYSHSFQLGYAAVEEAARAVRASEHALQLDPDLAEAHAARGYIMFVVKKYDEAEQEFETAIKLGPNRFETYYEYGRTCAARGQFEKAANLYIKAAEINPADYLAPMMLAQVYASLGKKHEQMKLILDSLDILERHIKLNPHDSRALCWAAGGFQLVGEHQRANELAERALEQGSDEPVVLYNTACFYALGGDKERALNSLEKATQLGYGNRSWVQTDSDLESLHREDRFKAMLARMH